MSSLTKRPQNFFLLFCTSNSLFFWVVAASSRDAAIRQVLCGHQRCDVLANDVYHATKSDGIEIDMYKEITVSEINGYCSHNPRKMVKAWAEKEQRNLKRSCFPNRSWRCTYSLFVYLYVNFCNSIGNL